MGIGNRPEGKSIAMGGRTFGNNVLRKVNFKNILSFGDKGLGEDGSGLEMKPLNVLIGANGSGKSNFLSCLELMSASAGNYLDYFRNRYGLADWMHKGRQEDESATLEVQFVVDGLKLGHEVVFGEPLQLTERLEVGGVKSEWHTMESRRQANARSQRSFASVVKDRSGVAHRKQYMKFYSGITVLFPESFHFASKFRGLMRAQDYHACLLSDFENLYDVLWEIQENQKELKGLVDERLSQFLGERCRYHVERIKGDYWLEMEIDGEKIPSSHLSNGTFRFLTLVVALFYSGETSLLCLESPELGMHPDSVVKISELLRDFSRKKQIVVTTHSERLVDCLSDQPEAIVVCERIENASRMTRLDQDSLKSWLDESSRDGLWSKGVPGGNRC